MALHLYRYVGNPYPPDVGVLLPGLNVPLFPNQMTDADVELLTGQFPILDRYFEKQENEANNEQNIDEPLNYLLQELKAQMSNLTFL